MKKIIRLSSLLVLLGMLVQANIHFEKNEKCSACHPQIYKEYQSSQHANATVFKDEIHGAVYEKHPQKNKLQKYRCAKCHTPTADNLSELLTPKNGVIPDVQNETQNEAVACSYCHRIEDVQIGKAMNKNIISKEPLSYFSNKEPHATSTFHKITTKKDIFKDAKLCMGCHAHKSNKKGFDVCATDIGKMSDGKNCISCHMPKVAGSASNIHESKEHTFHGFPGLHGDLSLLSKYITFDLNQSADAFSIVVKHHGGHSSTLHPIRLSKLLVSVNREGNITEMKTQKFFKMIGVKGQPTPPWLASQIIKEKRLAPKSKNVYTYDFKLQKGDKVTVTFGHLLVNSKMLKKLNLERSEEAKKFRILSQKVFSIK